MNHLTTTATTPTSSPIITTRNGTTNGNTTTTPCSPNNHNHCSSTTITSPIIVLTTPPNNNKDTMTTTVGTTNQQQCNTTTTTEAAAITSSSKTIVDTPLRRSTYTRTLLPGLRRKNSIVLLQKQTSLPSSFSFSLSSSLSSSTNVTNSNTTSNTIIYRPKNGSWYDNIRDDIVHYSRQIQSSVSSASTSTISLSLSSRTKNVPKQQQSTSSSTSSSSPQRLLKYDPMTGTTISNHNKNNTIHKRKLYHSNYHSTTSSSSMMKSMLQIMILLSIVFCNIYLFQIHERHYINTFIVSSSSSSLSFVEQQHRSLRGTGTSDTDPTNYNDINLKNDIPIVSENETKSVLLYNDDYNFQETNINIEHTQNGSENDHDTASTSNSNSKIEPNKIMITKDIDTKNDNNEQQHEENEWADNILMANSAIQ